jgi:hypothetical protein
VKITPHRFSVEELLEEGGTGAWSGEQTEVVREGGVAAGERH